MPTIDWMTINTNFSSGHCVSAIPETFGMSIACQTSPVFWSVHGVSTINFVELLVCLLRANHIAELLVCPLLVHRYSFYLVCLLVVNRCQKASE